jgi:hypothetical protein
MLQAGLVFEVADHGRRRWRQGWEWHVDSVHVHIASARIIEHVSAHSRDHRPPRVWRSSTASRDVRANAFPASARVSDRDSALLRSRLV